jgi:hypothetical protein
VERRRTIPAASLIDVRPMFDKRSDGFRASKSHGMVKRRDAVLVDRVKVGASLQRQLKPPPLIDGLWIALTTNVE